MKRIARITLTVAVLGAVAAACTNHAGNTGILSPAPTACGYVRGGPIGLPAPTNVSADDLLAGHVPGWLPVGFGIAQRGAVGPAGAIRWTDASCRAIQVIYEPHPPSEPMAGSRYGRWIVYSPEQGDFIYETQVPVGDTVIVFHALDRATMNRVANSIPH